MSVAICPIWLVYHSRQQDRELIEQRVFLNHDDALEYMFCEEFDNADTMHSIHPMPLYAPDAAYTVHALLKAPVRRRVRNERAP